MEKENFHYLTQAEVAARFRVTQSTIKNWRDQGKLEYFQPDGSTRVLYPREAVEQFERRFTKRAKIKLKPAEIKREDHGISSTVGEWRI